MNTTCYWMWVGDRWVTDVTKPPTACPWPQECDPPEEDGTFIGQTAENECHEDPVP